MEGCLPTQPFRMESEQLGPPMIGSGTTLKWPGYRQGFGCQWMEGSSKCRARSICLVQKQHIAWVIGCGGGTHSGLKLGASKDTGPLEPGGVLSVAYPKGSFSETPRWRSRVQSTLTEVPRSYACAPFLRARTSGMLCWKKQRERPDAGTL